MAVEKKAIRWLHLSDFHVGKDDYATLKMFDYIKDHVEERKKNGFVPDLLFFTGDLSDKGLAHEYETFWLNFVSPLQDVIGGDITKRTFAVPGNHDVDRTKNPAFSQDDISNADSHYLDPTDEGARLRGDMLIPRFRAYLDYDCSHAKGAFARREGAFSLCEPIHGQEVGIVGINTAWISKDNKDKGKLTPGKSLLEEALNAIKPTRLRIVLGHHPIDWFCQDQQRSIKSLLGQHHVLYLHGHLHDAWTEPTYGGGQSYLAIQSGAAFQARENRPWRNGLVWGEADLDVGEVRLQPCSWSSRQQAWTLDTDAFHEGHRQGEWWHYHLPGTQRVKINYAPSIPNVQLPKGWAVYKSDDLAPHCSTLAADEALRFFDGAVPDWSSALSTSIPRRKIVARLVDRFRHAESANRPIVTLLLAAGCEGKTTAMLQAAHDIIRGREDWRILQRRDESRALVVDDILPVLSDSFHWLLVLDEPDQIANDLLLLLDRLPHELYGRVHALLACRDSDWRASEASKADWSASTEFHRELLVGLAPDDAQLIVHAWRAYDKAGLGNLYLIPDDLRVEALVQQAKEEAKTTSGAFFGALLAVRNGAELHSHAQRMLNRLGARKIRGSGTLRDALAYIAAMHAEGLEFLSRPVLAQALDCQPDKLYREVLAPLGQEAATTTTASFIFIRHRRIAVALVSVLEEDFGEEISRLFIRLGEAAIDAFNNGEYVLELGRWRFKLFEHFFAKGQHDLAFRIAQAILAREPMNSLTRTHVANLYRKAKVPEQAVDVFRKLPSSVKGDRVFYFEWGVAEGECGNHFNNILLASYSLSDQCPAAPVDNDGARMTLAGLGAAFGPLYEAYHNPTFRDARMAVAVLGQSLRLDPTSEAYFRSYVNETSLQGAEHPDLEQAFALLRAAVIAAAQGAMNTAPAALFTRADDLTFKGLEQIIFNSKRISS